MPVAAVHGYTPDSALAFAGTMFSFSRDTAATLLRAVAVAAEGEDAEADHRPRRIGFEAGVVTATDMHSEIATILAERQETLDLQVRDCGQDHGRGQDAKCLVVKRPSSTSK